MTGADLALLGGLLVAVFVFLWLDLHFFARGREPSFREAVIWSIGWLVLSLLAAIPVYLLEGGEDAVLYTTVYLIERSLSLDNLFVFLLLFSYFGVPYERRPRLLFWGIVAALAMRGVFILAGVELIEQLHIVIYLLGAALLVLAYRIFRGVSENVDPDKNLMVRLVRKVYPVTDEMEGGHWFVKKDGKRYATPIFLCLSAIVFADLAFAIDSIPAAFAITRDPLLIWMGNVFALLGMRALFVLVESLVARFRYLDETIAIVLGLVGVKLLIEDLVEIGPLPSLAVIAVAFTIGIVASIMADRRDPDSERKREQRVENMKEGSRGLAGRRRARGRPRAREGRGRRPAATGATSGPSGLRQATRGETSSGPRGQVAGRPGPGELPLERGQPVVPLASDLGHPGQGLGHRGGGGAVEHLPPRAAGGHEAGPGQRAQVLLHRLAGDRQVARKIGGAGLAVAPEPGQKAAPGAVGEGGEDRVRRVGLGHQRSRPAPAALSSGVPGRGRPSSSARSRPRASSTASGRVSVTRTRVPSSTSSSSSSTRLDSSPGADHQNTSRRGGSASSTKPLRSPALTSPAGRRSRVASVPSHSGRASERQTSSACSGTTSSRSTT